MKNKELNNDIKEVFCSFEVSKLLKEKGFKLKPRFPNVYYNHKGEFQGDVLEYIKAVFAKDEDAKQRYESIAAPTPAVAMSWLRENFNIDIAIHRSFSMFTSYHFSVLNDMDYDNVYQQEVTRNRKYEEAVESALLYALKNYVK
jgi:hypothetical protein